MRPNTSRGLILYTVAEKCYPSPGILPLNLEIIGPAKDVDFKSFYGSCSPKVLGRELHVLNLGPRQFLQNLEPTKPSFKW